MNSDSISKFIKILAEAESSLIFNTEYIKRFIDYQWKSAYLQIGRGLAFIYGLSFVLTIISGYLCTIPNEDEMSSLQ